MPTDNDDKVVGLRNYNPDKHLNSQPNQDVIDKCQSMLEDAKSGRLKSIATVCVLNDRSTGTGWFGDCDSRDMSHGITTLFYRYIKSDYERED